MGARWRNHLHRRRQLTREVAFVACTMTVFACCANCCAFVADGFQSFAGSSRRERQRERSQTSAEARIQCGTSRRQGVLTTAAATASDAATEGAQAETATSWRSMGDREILSNLRARHGWGNEDMGAGGNCLFLSIAPQVSGDEVAEFLERSERAASALPAEIAERWKGLSNGERASVLRQMAILQEKDFVEKLQSLRQQKLEVAPADAWIALELFKDMAEEFISTGDTHLAVGINSWDMPAIYRRVRQAVKETSPDDIQDFVLKYAEEYMRRTGTEGNWAGSSEMVALSVALRRPFAAYGNNWVSQDAIAVEEVGGDLRVLPYFQTDDCPGAREAYRPGVSPVKIFQTGGGGHYQMLS